MLVLTVSHLAGDADPARHGWQARYVQDAAHGKSVRTAAGTGLGISVPRRDEDGFRRNPGRANLPTGSQCDQACVADPELHDATVATYVLPKPCRKRDCTVAKWPDRRSGLWPRVSFVCGNDEVTGTDRCARDLPMPWRSHRGAPASINEQARPVQPAGQQRRRRHCRMRARPAGMSHRRPVAALHGRGRQAATRDLEQPGHPSPARDCMRQDLHDTGRVRLSAGQWQIGSNECRADVGLRGAWRKRQRRMSDRRHDLAGRSLAGDRLPGHGERTNGNRFCASGDICHPPLHPWSPVGSSSGGCSRSAMRTPNRNAPCAGGPNHPQALLALAERQLTQGDFAAARDSARRLLVIHEPCRASPSACWPRRRIAEGGVPKPSRLYRIAERRAPRRPADPRLADPALPEAGRFRAGAGADRPHPADVPATRGRVCILCWVQLAQDPNSPDAFAAVPRQIRRGVGAFLPHCATPRAVIRRLPGG